MDVPGKEITCFNPIKFWIRLKAGMKHCQIPSTLGFNPIKFWIALKVYTKLNFKSITACFNPIKIWIALKAAGQLPYDMKRHMFQSY